MAAFQSIGKIAPLGCFGDALHTVKTRLQKASQSIDDTEKRSEKMRDKLRAVEEAPTLAAPPPPALSGADNDNSRH